MKRNGVLNSRSIIYILFIIATIISMFIVYKNISNTFAVRFVMGYVIFTFMFIFYIGLITILDMRKLRWIEIRKRLCRFFIIFITFLTINIILTYLIKGKVTILNHVAVPFGTAFGVSFYDLIFFKNKEQ